MRNAQKPDHISLNTLISRLRDGRYVIPDFQREFEWEPWDITALIRSIFLDYYIGSLLLWKGKRENFEALSCESVYGFNGNENPEYIVLDGQQRLTALYYAFFAPDVPLPDRATRAIYFVKIDKFMGEEYDEAFYYDWLSRRWSRILANKELQYEQHIFPLSVLGAGTGYEVAVWVLGYQQYWRDKAAEARNIDDAAVAELADFHAGNAEAFGQHLKETTEEYQISYIELDQDLAVEKVCDIFTQVNSRGVRLDVFDLINALLRPKEIMLKAMMRDAAPRLEFVDTSRMNVYILQVMSILRQAYCSPKYLYYLMPGNVKHVRDPDGTRRTEVLVPDADDFRSLWDRSVRTLESSIQLLRHPQEFGAISSKYLPYASILPVFSALQSYVDSLPPEQKLHAKRKIRHWYWASVFTKRYSGSVESTSARDYLDVKSWINNEAEEPALINEFSFRLRNLDLTNETTTNSSVYSAIFNLLVLRGARDWMTGDVPQHDDLDDHHIIPAAWGADNLNGNLGHSILNRTPLTAETNRHIIGSKLPNEYLPELMEKNGEAAVRAILESHLISPTSQEVLLRNPFTPDDYQEFIAERQRTIQDSIESLLIKERLDLAPQLRDLDEKMEHIELKLRATVVGGLESDPTKLPSHVMQKLNERIDNALKKNAALDEDYYQELKGKLEYADLRELQDTFTNKTLWPNFEQIFASKEMLNLKFSQLADLRNGIRHSRTVDEITRKEGEASLIWFEQVLAK